MTPNGEQSGSTAKIRYSLADGSVLPNGLTLSADGIISGTPTTTCKDYKFTVIASAIGFADRATTYTISVYYNVVFESTNLHDGKFGEDYLASIAANTDSNNMTYYLKEGSTLPKGLVLSSSGYIVGIPCMAVANHKFTVVATSPDTSPVEATFTISVGISFNSNLSLPDTETKENYYTAVSACGASNIRYYLADGSMLPKGLVLQSDGVIYGSPTRAGVYTFTVIAEAEGISTDAREFTIYVAQGPMTIWDWIVWFFTEILDFFSIK